MARPLPRDSLSLTAGGAALVTDATGAIEFAAVSGLFIDDLRFVSSWTVTPSLPVSLVGRQALGPSCDRLVFTIARATSIDPVGTFQRLRSLGPRGYTEELLITAYAQAVTCSLRLAAGRDDRPVFEVGDDRHRAPRHDTIVADDAIGTFTLPGPAGGVGVTLVAPGWDCIDGNLVVDVNIAAGTTWTGSIHVTVPGDLPAVSTGQLYGEASGLRVWTSPEALGALVDSGRADLRALAIPVGGRLILGAGSPFFLALFGRDSLIAGMQALVDVPERLTDILSVLAAHQATSTDEVTRAEPGRILHELRVGCAGVFGVPPGVPYYGAVDTSSLFVVALGEAWRWGLPDDDIATLMPVADAALEWCRQYGDVDGDGFIESVPHATGLTNLGWKDSADSMVDEDGRTYVGTVALAEVQAYHYRALRTMAELEQYLGLGDGGERLAAAGSLAARFADAFCYDRDGRPFVGLALDADKRAARRRRIERRPRAMDGHPPPGTCRRGGRPARCRRPVLRLGRAHAEQQRSWLQPVRLPPRLGVAARHRARPPWRSPLRDR